MNTSTHSAMEKLYSVLRGYEVCAYTGKGLSQLVTAANNLIAQEVYPLEIDDCVKAEITNCYLKSITAYLKCFFRGMQDTKTSEQSELLANYYKEDQKSLQHLVSRLLERNLSFASICPTNGGQIKNVITVTCDKCPYYLSQKFYFCSITSDEYLADLDVERFPIKFKRKESYIVALLIFKLTHILKDYAKTSNEIEQYDFANFKDVLFACITFTQGFKLMNPTGKVRLNQLLKAKDLITEPSTTMDPSVREQKIQIMKSVFNDIEEGKLPYIQNLKRSVDTIRQIISQGYDDKYLYYSLKGTGQRIYTHEGVSLLSSMKEFDIHKLDYRVINFDRKFFYHSTYSDPPSGNLPVVRILGINNPNKFKIRIIHIGDNPIQDRCNFLNYATLTGLKRSKSDSFSDHDVGRNIARQWTRDWLIQDEASRESIVGTDFSNATDTLDQEFSHLINEYVFGPEVADFWDYCSTLPKIIDYRQSLVNTLSSPNSRSERKRIEHLSDEDFFKEFGVYPTEVVQQTCGQPQGFLFSFGNFSLCHQFVLAASMKELDMILTDPDLDLDLDPKLRPVYRRTEDCFIIIGDDNVSKSILPESFYKMNGLGTYIGDHFITKFHQIYFEFCQHLAGWEINYDKCTFCHNDSLMAEIDLASVTVRNGEFFSPIPFRLAMNLNGSFDNALSIAVWLLDRKMDLDNRADSIIQFWLSKLPDNTRKLYEELCYNFYYAYLNPLGEYNYISPFNTLEQFILRFCSLQAYLESAILKPFLPDQYKSLDMNNTWDYALSLIDKKHKDQLDKFIEENPDHKVSLLQLKNHDILNLISDCKIFDSLEDKIVWASISQPSLEDEDEIFNFLKSYADLRHTIELINENDHPEEIVLEHSSLFERSNDKEFRNSVNRFSQRFLTRGSTKRPPLEVQIFRNTLDLWNFYKDSPALVSSRKVVSTNI